MRRKIILLSFIFAIISKMIAQDSIIISGQIKDFFGNPDKWSNANLAPPKEMLDVQVYFDEVPVSLKSIQEISEYTDSGKCSGYLLFVDLTKESSDKPYEIVRIVAEDKENGDKGETIYFKNNEN